jgi:hypothetical protein
MTNRYLNHFLSQFPKMQTFSFMSYDQEIVRVETLCDVLSRLEYGNFLTKEIENLNLKITQSHYCSTKFCKIG